MYFGFLPTLFLGGSRGARSWDADAPFALSTPAIMIVDGEHFGRLGQGDFWPIRFCSAIS